MAFDKKHALTVLADAQISTGGNLAVLKKLVVDQLGHVQQAERETALRALLIGIALHRIKASLKHGEWMPWQEQNLAAKKSQVNNYMRLSLVFIAKVKATKPELLALDCSDDLVPHTGNAIARRLFERAEKFVGERSLTELLVRYGIKSIERGDDDEAEGGGSSSKAGEQMVFAELAGYFSGIRDTLLSPANLMRLEPKQLEIAKRELDAIHAQFSKLYEKARSKKG